MVPIARLNLLSDKGRLFSAIGGVSFAVTLILLIQALYLGYQRSSAAFIDNLPVEVWVGQSGAYDLFRSTTVLPSDLFGRIQAIEGVADVGRLRGRQTVLDTPKGRVVSLLLAFDAGASNDAVADTLGTRKLPEAGQITISRYVQQHGGLRIGDTIYVGGVPLKVSGLLDAPSPPYGSFSIVNYAESGTILSMSNSDSYFMVSLLNPSQTAPMVARLKNNIGGGISAYSREEFSTNNGRVVHDFLPVVAVILVVSYLVGIMVASLTIYTATVEKARDYGVLKAIGATNSFVYKIVAYQSLGVCVIGFSIGLPISLLLSQLARERVSEFVTHFELKWIIAAFLAIVIMGLVSALLPARRIGRIDPAMVFKA